MTEIATSDEFEEPEELAQADAFLQSVKHKQPRTVSVKKFLALWGYKKRGAHILRVINRELSRRGLVTSPDIALADYYGDIEILYQQDLSGRPEVEIGWPVSSVLDPERELVVVGPDESLSRVETLMIINDFSQIPVMNKNRRELHGSVTWQSIARWQGDKSGATARHVMDKERPTARSSDSLLMHINRIIENEFLYIQDPTGLYVGVLTSTDLAEGFLTTAGPFIKIGEIENRLRALVNHLPLPVIHKVAELSGATRAIESADDLSFGQYVAILEKGDNWQQLNLSFDRKTVIENLRDVNTVRNDVMHFRPTELDAQATEVIDKCLNWLRAIPNA